MKIPKDLEKKIVKEIFILAKFVRIYCKSKHRDTRKTNFDINLGVADDRLSVNLCEDCAKLLSHGIIMRIKCPMNPKPMCKKCPDQCYNEYYLRQIVEVMKFSGMKMILRGRVDLIYHYFF